MREEKYYEILAIIDAMKDEVCLENEKMIAKGITKTHIQNVPKWTPDNYPYQTVDPDRIIKTAMWDFNDCYLNTIYRDLRNEELTEQVPYWGVAQEEIVDALNIAERLIKEINKVANIITIKGHITQLSANAVTDDIISTLKAIRKKVHFTCYVMLYNQNKQSKL